MRDLFKKPGHLIRLEFWGITTLFVFFLFVFIVESLNDGSNSVQNVFNRKFDAAGIHFFFYYHYLIPVVIEFLFQIAAFYLLNFYVVPRLIEKRQVVGNLALVVGVFLFLGLVDAITDRFIHAYQFVGNTARQNRPLIWQSFASPIGPFILFGVYTLIKYTGLYFIKNSRMLEQRYRFVHRDGVNAFVVWLISMFLLIVLEAENEIVVGWGVIGPVGILLYCFSFYKLIPTSIGKKAGFLRYMFKVAFVLALFLLPVFMVSMLSLRSENGAAEIMVFNFFFQLLITGPLSWLLFKRYLKGNEEVLGLQKELGRSNANLDFLRSQINPHFLFNALNTLYGTAIQEKAERTSEGIEKLGDMMRFMLQENMQEKISLAREIDYLNNYISLQRLRTDPNPEVRIQTEIQERDYNYQIAPMLLIPFVENAFKHGISFREPSHIKVTLEIRDRTLYFDVYNSRHIRSSYDPEKDKSGIGLENVKQRLNLLYPKKHELIIRDTTKEYFIHLTIQLA